MKELLSVIPEGTIISFKMPNKKAIADEISENVPRIISAILNVCLFSLSLYSIGSYGPNGDWNVIYAFKAFVLFSSALLMFPCCFVFVGACETYFKYRSRHSDYFDEGCIKFNKQTADVDFPNHRKCFASNIDELSSALKLSRTDCCVLLEKELTELLLDREIANDKIKRLSITLKL